MRINDWSSDVCSSDLAGELRRALAAFGQPIGNGIRRGEAAGREIIGPAERTRPAFARPLLEPERREIGLVDVLDKLFFLIRPNRLLSIGEARRKPRIEKAPLLGQCADPDSA